jgi:RHS repeat-associated protein
VFADRLGSNRYTGNYYPYGDSVGAAPQDQVGFATYTQDSYTGLDYANQRMYASTYGRFNTPDPYLASAKGVDDPATPGSWDRYGYVLGDPINNRDRRGTFLEDCPEEGCGDDGDDDGDDDGGVTWVNRCIALVFGVPYYACGYSYTAVPLMQGVGAGGLITVTNLSTTSVKAVIVQNDLRWLQQAIQQDPTCSGWLQGSYNAINFMLDVPGSTASMMAVGVGNFSPAGTNAVAGVSGTNLPAGMLITVALNGAFFNAGPSGSVGYGLPAWITGGSYAAQAEMLLHELAHDLGAAGFQADGPLPNGQPNVNAQTTNNGLVMQNCGSVVSVAAGRN